MLTVSGPITNAGEILVKVKFQNREHMLTLFILDSPSNFTPLLGRVWLDTLIPNWRDTILSSHNVNNVIQVPTIAQLTSLFPRVFDSKADTVIEGFQAKLTLKDNFIPVFARAYSVAFALAFNKCKQLLLDSQLLLHFDPNLSIVIYTDASPYGVGCVLNHHWAAKLQGYQYKLIHRKAEFLAAPDALSRLPHNAQSVEPVNSTINLIDLNNITPTSGLPISAALIAQATACDPVLQKVLIYVHSGWPPNCNIKNDPALSPYFKERDNISIVSKCLMLGNRVIIPLSHQQDVLKLLHAGHPGISRSKMLARSFFWWPTLNSDLQTLVKYCDTCAIHNFTPDSETTPWPLAKYPFQRVHIDFYQQHSVRFLIFIDAFSKCIPIHSHHFYG
ncbi:hypothetical protein KUF71_006236 [Frankliniella fusca]|uniref:RNA-directed DNA polymerase n=1 Tax=Frankliniella fusca TaxID=407009 RepID=A0AAE1LFQ7_9NEOP|nr:hypothetical protein KUF71_006236 [Frankliniella fusca]